VLASRLEGAEMRMEDLCKGISTSTRIVSGPGQGGPGRGTLKRATRDRRGCCTAWLGSARPTTNAKGVDALFGTEAIILSSRFLFSCPKPNADPRSSSVEVGDGDGRVVHGPIISWLKVYSISIRRHT
jgi:hypothetical protein